MTNEESPEWRGRCDNCLERVEDGLEFDGSRYCSEFCAEVAAGYWSRSGRAGHE